MNNDCPNCGAPHTGSHQCGYCGTALYVSSPRPLTRNDMRALTAEARQLRRTVGRPRPKASLPLWR